ncbi:enhancer of mRNA decapping [Umbelopsis nana]
MAQAFLGLRVSIVLNTGLSLEGKVSHIDSDSQLLTLNDVLIFIPGQATQRTPLYGVNGSDIKDLQILPDASSISSVASLDTQQQKHAQYQQPQQRIPPQPAIPPQPKPKPPLPPSVRSTAAARNGTVQGKQIVYDARAKPVDESSATESAAVAKTKKKKGKQLPPEPIVNEQATARKTKNGQKIHAPPVHAWAGGDVNDFKEEEFDFQANLDMFDKAKVFAEIREMDETAPETRLVSINRLPQGGRGSQTPSSDRLTPSSSRINLLPTENVLDEQIDPGALSDDSMTSEGFDHMRGKRRGSKQARTKIVVMSSGILCPPVTAQQMTMVEQECGLSRDQLIENAGRVSSMMALQTMGGFRRGSDQSKAAPLVVMLAGNNTIGAYGFSAARHLANHGCTVVACTASAPPYHGLVATHQKMFEYAGGRTISSISQLPDKPIDLIIDALMGVQYYYKDLLHDKKAHQSTTSLISWANANAAPILSLDFPSGNQYAQDYTSEGPHRIHPKWTLCLGAPKVGCNSRSVTGELYMADLGIPRGCWKRVGVKGGSGMPWGADFLVALEYM